MPTGLALVVATRMRKVRHFVAVQHVLSPMNDLRKRADLNERVGTKPSRVYGVDFSGAKDADRKIWIAGGEVNGDTMRLELCRRLENRAGPGSRLERALAALRTFVTQQAPCVVGLDFPFGLPQILVEEEQWMDFAFGFGNRFLDADTFPVACRTTAFELTGRKELRRVTDIEAKTPLSPYNRRIFRQTYYGIRDVLAPLIADGVACALPMQTALPDRAWLLEICPASTLEMMGLRKSYKDEKGRDFHWVRDAILTEVTHPFGIEVPEQIRREVVADKKGDALDSIIAAVATLRALRESITLNGSSEPSLVEGRVYV
jgi:hypothetical protein